MFDSHSNFGYSTVTVAPVPALAGLSLTVAVGQGALFTAPCNCTVWPTGVAPLAANAEIVRVTAILGDVLTIIRAQEGTAARSIVVGDQIANTTSVKVFTDIENAIPIQFVSNISAVGGSASAQVVFSNSNGVSFGLNAQTITASHDGITSQSNPAFSAQGGSSTFQTLNFNNANGLTFSNNAGAVEASYTVPTQSTQPVAASASNGSFLFSTLGFSNANGVTFGTSAGSIITASVPAGVAPGSISAGANSVALGQVVFSNSNNVSFGLNGSTVTASASAASAAVAFSASGGSSTFQTLPFNNANGITFSNNAGSVEASYTVPTITNSSWTVSDAATSGTVARLAFTNLNGITFSISSGTGGLHTIVGSHNALTIQSIQPVAASASNGSFLFSTLAFSNANGVTFGTSAGSIISASHNGITSQSNQQVTMFATSNTTQSSTGTANVSSLIFAGAGNVSVGITGGSVVISGATAAGVTEATLSDFSPWILLADATNQAAVNNVISFAPFDLACPLFASRINFYVSLSGSLANANSTGTCYAAAGFGLYTRNVTGADSQTLNLMTSYSLTIAEQSHNSNTQYAATHYVGLSNASSHSTSQVGITNANATTYQANSINGYRALALPMFSSTMTPGRYWLGFSISTVTGNAMANNVSVLVGLSPTMIDVRPWGTSSAATNASVFREFQGIGSFTATTAAWPATIAFTTDNIRALAVNNPIPKFDIRGYGTSTNLI